MAVGSPESDHTGVEAERQGRFILSSVEKRLLEAIARRLPRRVLPDDLTALGVLAAFGVMGAYALSNESTAWLWAASALLVLQWAGDSLDGTLARVRRIERPRYGYYLDHVVDAIATAAIGIGLGLSPYMDLWIGVLIVVLYLVLSINVYLESMAFGEFDIAYGKLGPTELRLVLITLNTLLALGVAERINLPAGVDFTPLDLVGLAIVGVMGVLLAGRAIHNLRRLAAEEPAASRSGSR